ncbi:MAG: hypothetical protein IMZ67_10005, partial [Acidobacteria bacterium]|nr:hypothetical protein [Acidobacteriota bacterium]
EVRVTNVRTATAIGAQTADQGREFVIVESAWKNVMPLVPVNRKKAQDRTVGMGALGFGGGATAADKAKDEANTTLEPMKFAIGPMPSHVWLIVDGRFAEEIDVRATNATDGHLPAGTLMIPALNDVRSGGLVYQAPVNAQALSLLVLDSNNGHLLLPLKGAPPALASSLGGKSRANEVVDLVVIGTAWAEPPADAPGMKTLVVSVKGISRQNAIADVPFGEFGFLQTDQGCVAQPEEQSSAVTRPLAPIGRFLPMVPNEGQLAFTVPSGTRSAILMLRARSAAAIDLPALGDGTVSKPTASATHQDGSVLRVSVVGTGVPPADLPAPPAGSEYLVVDYIVENLTTGTGIELQPQQQFALVDSAGKQYRPASASRQLPCRLTGEGVVPAGGWRRFSLLYAVPARQPLNVQYRGFESAGTLKVR